MPLQVGVIGLGQSWHERIRPVLDRLSNLFLVVSLHDPVAHRARRQAVELGCDVTEGFRVLISRCDVQAILLVSPTWYGPLPLLACCELNKPVLVNYPLPADELADAQTAQRLASCRAPVELALSWSWAPATARLARLCRDRLGTPKQVEFTVGTDRVDTGGSADAALQQAIYWISTIRDRQAVRLESLTSTGTGWSGTVGGIPFTVAFTTQADQGHDDARSHAVLIRVTAERGTATVRLPETIEWSDGGEVHREQLTAEPAAEERALRHFYDVVIEGATPILDLAGGIELARAAADVTRSRGDASQASTS